MTSLPKKKSLKSLRRQSRRENTTQTLTSSHFRKLNMQNSFRTQVAPSQANSVLLFHFLSGLIAPQSLPHPSPSMTDRKIVLQEPPHAREVREVQHKKQALRLKNTIRKNSGDINIALFLCNTQGGYFS
ncbi:hypothetical protein TNIN_335381 [Trichonephila inaurata madagascariensis]|uniref:Uncharacterized protein n=1 Tax=Trichonephila inaurata madagascariensis TaxID=2747483 RepID=A0A8X7BQC9_9ARAC|nr:hypothetical protein TNIN_335381 [Trichonephila inaurata madagascariensis]